MSGKKNANIIMIVIICIIIGACAVFGFQYISKTMNKTPEVNNNTQTIDEPVNNTPPIGIQEEEKIEENTGE